MVVLESCQADIADEEAADEDDLLEASKEYHLCSLSEEWRGWSELIIFMTLVVAL